MRARFFYDFSSPYSYLAANRIERVFGDDVQWTPIVFGAVLAAQRREPWSFAEDRSEHFAEIERRARALGLAEVRYPEGWPRETWTVLPLRATLAAGPSAKRLTLALYAEHFERGRVLDAAAVADAARVAGLDPEPLLAAAETDAVRARLRENTDAALAAGVEGIPTVAVGPRPFWGEDRLAEAAAEAGH